MHELSIAQNIVEIVKQNVPQEDLKGVTSIKLKIGDMSGVVTESLEFGFLAIISGTELEDAKLDIEKIPFFLKCNECKQESSNEYGSSICPECGSSNTTILSGLELQIIEVELREETLLTSPLRGR